MRCAQEIDECVPDFTGEGRHPLAYLSAVLTRPNVSPPQHLPPASNNSTKNIPADVCTPGALSSG
jgi:hypothetical protein